MQVSCFAVLQQIRSICRYVTRSVLLLFVVSLVLMRFDCGVRHSLGFLTDRWTGCSPSSAGCRSSTTSLDCFVIYTGCGCRRVFLTSSASIPLPTWPCAVIPCHRDPSCHRDRIPLETSVGVNRWTGCAADQTIGDHSFLVAVAHAWNSLLASVTSTTSLLVFKQWLKTKLFPRSHDVTLSLLDGC